MTTDISDIKIELARPEDVDALWNLYQRTVLNAYVDEKAGITETKLKNFLGGDTPYFPKYWEPYLEKPSKERTVYVARHGGEIVGMVSPAFVNGHNRLTALYVAPEAQEMGIGTKLMETALKHYGNTEIRIGVAYHIEWLPHFYESFGFEAVKPRTVTKYPHDPISYLEMVRPAAKSLEGIKGPNVL